MALLKMREEGTQCSVNPLKYGVQQIEKENDALFQCTCGLDGGTPLILDNTGLRTLNFP